MSSPSPFLFDTVLPADSVECIPTATPDLSCQIISLGTYQYNEATRTRSGFLKLLALRASKEDSLSTSGSLSLYAFTIASRSGSVA